MNLFTPHLGANITKCILNRYNFKFKANILYKCITDASCCTSAFNILLLDFRHYESHAEFLKAVLIAVQHISNFYLIGIKGRLPQPNEKENLAKIEVLVKNYFAQLSHLPKSIQYLDADKGQIDLLNENISGFEQALFDKLCPILNILESDTKDFNLDVLLGHLFTVESNEHTENITDLQSIYEPSKVEKEHLHKSAKVFIHEVRKLYRLITSAPENTDSCKVRP